MKQHSGTLIVLEGIDGSGKSTLARKLENKLQEHHTILLTKEPGATSFGKKLLQNLIHDSEQTGIWTLQAGIFPENIASIKLHKSS